MIVHDNSISTASIAPLSLLQQLAVVLPKDINFKIYHLSTAPTRTSALYSAPPGARPDRTYCENHFLSASIQTNSQDELSEGSELLVFAIEVLIYSTAHDTTFFVSKADSTGYLHLLNLPKGSPSPLREISTIFLRFLLDQRRRTNVRSVVSLFARAQDQYLFPGSVEYSGKHVLDDRGLVRWWCRVLDPLTEVISPSKWHKSHWDSVNGYLMVPGLDTHETRSFLPRGTKAIWTIGHPLQKISRHSHDVPPRCLVPHFPDDPKSRYLNELDDEISKGQNSENGQWKSVKTVDQFWDMMAFRQECSAGRLVGFIWIVFTPPTQHQPIQSTLGDSQTTAMTTDCQTWDVKIQPPNSPMKVIDQDSPISLQHSIRSATPRIPRKRKLSGLIMPRLPRVKTENKNYLLERPESTAYYIWTPEGRGQVIVEESDYKRVTELLLRLDFSNRELATSSSSRWINEVRSGAWGSMKEAWGQTVRGTKVTEAQNTVAAVGATALNMGLVRKKRKIGVDEPKEPLPGITNDSRPEVNILSTGVIRKKAKV